MKALWVEALGPYKPFENKARFEGLLSDLEVWRPSELFLQIYREGRSWFPSGLADPTPYHKCRDQLFDPLLELRKLCEHHNIKLHLWFNVFNLHSNFNAPVLLKNGLDILLTDNFGIRLDNYSSEGKPPGERGRYFSLDTPWLWLDPAAQEVQEYFYEIVREALSYVPGCGVHLDFFRYPYLLPIKPSSRIPGGADFGYGQRSIERYQRDTDNHDPFNMGESLMPKNDQAAHSWDNWRRTQVTRYLQDLRVVLPHGTELSVAGIAWADRAYLSSFQDWRGWMLDRTVDKLCLMSYTQDMRLFEYLVRQALAFKSKGVKLYAGIGAYMLPSLEEIRAQEQIADKIGSDGSILFSYGNIKSGKLTF